MNGHAFFCDEPENIDEELRTAAARIDSSVLDGETLNFEDHTLIASEQRRLATYRGIHQKKLDNLRAAGKPVPNGFEHILADLHHNPEKRMRMSSTGRVVGMLNHGCIWSERFRRSMTKREVLSLQGWPTIPRAHGSAFSFPWSHMLDEMTTSQVYSLTGNGMHLNVLMLVLAWGLACTEPAVDVEPEV